MGDYDGNQFAFVANWNCDKVQLAKEELENLALKQRNEKQKLSWRWRINNSTDLCKQARNLLEDRQSQQAAELAVQAYGKWIMRDKLCCTRLRPPYCVIPLKGKTLGFHTPTGVLMCVFAVTLVVMCIATGVESCVKRARAERMGEEGGDTEEEAPPPTTSSGGAGGITSANARLQGELLTEWMNRSPLRVLPGSQVVAGSAASLFASLQAAFEFQVDNVRNQYEHFMSMLFSHVATVADRYYAADVGAQVNEQFILTEALDDLHCELLEGFIKWRAKYREYGRSGMNDTDADVPPAGGILWERVPRSVCPAQNDAEAVQRSRQMVEIATYLCVWGEAGNVRYMPELLYFVTEMALAAERPEGAGFYGPAQPGTHSGRFLARIIRPLYSLVFDEWYLEVKINAKGGDAKKLHKVFQRYLLPDTANYDDWNEFFCDPRHVTKGLLLTNGRNLFELPHGQRFAALRDMHWAASLQGAQIKTHRECHSMWGVFAATHRVWLVHAVVFNIGVCVAVGDPTRSLASDWRERPLMGSTPGVRFAGLGLIVPVHALMWSLARLETSSNHVLKRTWTACFALKTFFWAIVWIAPIFTYLALRYVDAAEDPNPKTVMAVMVAHYATFLFGLWFLLLFPAKSVDRIWQLTRVPLSLRLVRYLFWAVIFGIKFLLGLVIFNTVFRATLPLGLVNVGRESPKEIFGLWRNGNWGASFFEWAMLWLTAFYMFVSDTQLWYQLGCMVMGVIIVFAQRGCRIVKFIVGDQIVAMPALFSKLVFMYTPKVRNDEISVYFPDIWDRIASYMRYEDKVESDAMGEMSFVARGRADRGLTWKSLSLSEHRLGAREKVEYPQLFQEITPCELIFRNYCGWKHNMNNADFVWRLHAISRGLGLPVPRPYRAPYIPGITVMIPHYGETIILTKKELYDPGSSNMGTKTHVKFGQLKVKVRETVPLIDWLRARYWDEFRAFTNRMQARGDWPSGNQWEDYTNEQWDKICMWSTMRMQTLYRTIAGMMLYHPALQVHYDVQRDSRSSLSQPGVWKPSDCFSCLVSMQIYKTFSEEWYGQVNKMFDKFPESLKIAFIDWEDLCPKGASDAQNMQSRLVATSDRVHKRQERRYYSCLIEKQSALASGSKRRMPKYRIELPGFPILGDGKNDNQNHAIPFMRGIFCQCIDANQGAYFEQMLLLPCVLGEFRTHARGRGKAKRIIGLPEHITSDFGSIGDFAAGSEIAFGTMSQRSFAVLGARMHYGHPDIMNKQYMIQQGGVSKATKTLNLSEDIFAGMDFTLRGEGRKIRHCEYFHLAKGRDLGFNAVLGFFSKLSNGTGEQILTRQMLRLAHVLQLPEFLSFYYAHAGYYITQYLVSMSMPITVFTWLIVLTGDCNQELRAFSDGMCTTPAAEAIAMILSTWYSVFIFFFLIAASLPLFVEIWMERNFGVALRRWLLQFLTCSFLLFIFQAKIIGFYIMAEIRQGGASYVATGRGLPTDRRDFVGAPGYVFMRLAVFLSGIDVPALGDSAELREAVMARLQALVAKSCGVPAQDIEVQMEGRKAYIVVRPTSREGEPPVSTISVRGKLAAPSLGQAIAAEVAQIPGIKKFAGATAITAQTSLVEARTGWKIETVGGLYLDYTQHTYYNAMDLLFFLCCVVYCGGFSDAGPYKYQLVYTFVSVGLVIFSWLYAPFIFNPYQFSARYVANDVKAWYGFFFADGGKNWVEWFQRVIIAPQRGVGKSLFDFDFVLMFFAVTAWISQMNFKLSMNEAIYDQDKLIKLTTIATMLPPFLMSTAYCLALSLVQWMLGCGSRRQKEGRRGGRGPFSWLYHRTHGEDTSSGSGTDSSDSEAGGRGTPGSRRGEAVVDVRHTMEDQAVHGGMGYSTCTEGVSLPISAAVVAGLQVIEMFAPMALCVHRPDRKLFVSGIVLKFMFWKVITHVLESSLSMKGVCKKVESCAPWVYDAVHLLTYANQMSRDIFVSAFIFITLGPFVILTFLNDMCCPRMSLHQALIFRAPGPLSSRQKRDGGDSSSDDESEGSGSDSASSGSPTSRRSGVRR